MAETTRALNFAQLVERIVPLVAELFATLASRDPLRMHFADIASKTLLDIVQVLRGDGMSQEAIAASLDMTINGFRRKLTRLQEAFETEAPVDPADRRRTLLERVHTMVFEEGGEVDGVTYARVSQRFSGVKGDSLKGVLHFLVQSGLLSVTGRGSSREYRIVPRRRAQHATYADAVVHLYRDGPMTLQDLSRRLELPEADCQLFVERLDAEGSLETALAAEGEDAGQTVYRATSYHIPMDNTGEGYEAALYDHLSSVIRSINKKIRIGRFNASLHDINGGTTFSFHVPEGDPLYAEVTGFLSEMRLRMEGYLERAKALDAQPTEDGSIKRVTLYTGQMVEDYHG